MWEHTAICSVLMPSSIDIYVAAARTYVLHVRVKTKMFQYISGKKFLATCQNCMASREYELCHGLWMLKKG